MCSSGVLFGVVKLFALCVAGVVVGYWFRFIPSCKCQVDYLRLAV